MPLHHLAKKCFPYWAILFLLFSMILVPGLVPAQAQDTTGDPWETPVNLSQSGSAEEPVIAAEPDGQLHVLWWDIFDLARYSEYIDTVGWTHVLGISKIRTTETGVPIHLTVLADANRQVHVFWLDDKNTLWYTKSVSGSGEFGDRISLVSNVLAWTVNIDHYGIMHMVYIQTGGPGLPAAGLYHIRSPNGVNWEKPVAIEKSPYFRTLDVSEEAISLVTDQLNNVLVAWDDPHELRGLLAISRDNGLNFTAPMPISSSDASVSKAASHPHLVLGQPGSYLLVTQQGDSCLLYQQLGGFNPAEGSKGSITWSSPERVWKSMNGCLQNIDSYAYGNGVATIIQTTPDTQGTSGSSGSQSAPQTKDIWLAYWDGSAWTEPVRLQVTYTDPITKGTTTLSCMKALIAAERIAVVGCDDRGDVWVTQSKIKPLDFLPQDKSVWTRPVLITSKDNIPADLPALAVDNGGRLLAIYPELEAGAPDLGKNLADTSMSGSGLAYMFYKSQAWSSPVMVLHTTTNLGTSSSPLSVYNPALQADLGGMAHVLWSGGLTGQIYFSGAYVRDATSSSGWRDPQPLASGFPLAGSPALAADANGKLYAAFTVPLNENRGVYFSTSTDQGVTWSPPKPVFAVAGQGADVQAEWPTLTSVQIGVDSQGSLHVVWVKAGLPPVMASMGVFYARSTDGGETWSAPVDMSHGVGGDPELVVASAQQLHIFWTRSTNSGIELYQQRSPDGGLTWSDPVSVPGVRTVAHQSSLVTDGQGTVFLVALEPNQQNVMTLVVIRWDGLSWGTSEQLALGYDWDEQAGVRAALLPSGDLVALYRVNGLMEGNQPIPALGFVSRPVDIKPAEPMPTFTPRPQPTAFPTPTEIATATPIATPDLQNAPPIGLNSSSWIKIMVIVVGMLVIVILSLRALLIQYGRKKGAR